MVVSLSFSHPQLVGDLKILGKWRNSCSFLMLGLHPTSLLQPNPHWMQESS